MKNQKTEKTIQEFTEAFQRLKVDQDILIIACNHHIALKEEAFYDRGVQKELREKIKEARASYPHYKKAEKFCASLYVSIIAEVTPQMNFGSLKAHRYAIDFFKDIITQIKT